MQKRNYQHILFDLDGTITDPMEGITKSVKYALAYFGIEVNDLRSLYPFIGPPLKTSFMEFYQFTEEQAEIAIVKYRDYFSTKGIHENVMYEGMDKLLQTLTQKGKKLYLATSKPEPFARQILKHFNLDNFFTFIGGSTFDGSRSDKADVIKYVLEETRTMDLPKVVMVGDRKYDIIGAKKNGIDTIGVLYGYGDENELREAGANQIVGDLHELLESLLTEDNCPIT